MNTGSRAFYIVVFFEKRFLGFVVFFNFSNRRVTAQAKILSMFRALEASYDFKVQGDSSSFTYTAQAISSL